MTKFKVGDRVKLIKIGGSIDPRWGYVGFDTATVDSATNKNSIALSMDNPQNGYYNVWVREDEIDFTDTTPPATIQHEDYNYTRGEPVVPEWVKDGGWVISTLDNTVVNICVDDRSIGVYNANGTYHSTIEISKADTYLRPFTDADWKWGMWAEYQGEKVFICKRGIAGVAVSRPTDGYFYAPFSEIIPTTAP